MSTGIAEAKTVSLTTFRKDGTPIACPIWIAGEGSLFHVMTAADSWKVKRIRNNPKVTIEISDSRGNVAEESTVYNATARVLDENTSQVAISTVKSKYGMMAKVMGFVSKLRGYTYVGVELTLV